MTIGGFFRPWGWGYCRFDWGAHRVFINNAPWRRTWIKDGTRIDADRLLLASGRRPRLGGLGLDALGLAVTPGMALPTTTRCEVTGVSRVWAAGDVTGTTHTHASRYQASVVAANICGQHREADYSAIPRCVFTTPSVFAVGVVPDARPRAARPRAAGG